MREAKENNNPRPDRGKDLMTVREVAWAAGLGRDAVYGLINAGALPTVQVGQFRYIPRAAYQRWLRGEAQPPKEES
jgi:excisionase family DNA binding protein